MLEGAKRLLFEEKDEVKVLNEALIECYVSPEAVARMSTGTEWHLFSRFWRNGKSK